MATGTRSDISKSASPIAPIFSLVVSTSVATLVICFSKCIAAFVARPKGTSIAAPSMAPDDAISIAFTFIPLSVFFNFAPFIPPTTVNCVSAVFILFTGWLN